VKEKLNKNNFLIFAMKSYNNPFCSGIVEFQEDILRIKYIKRLLFKFKKTGTLKTQLILNHVIIMQNLFGVEASVRILFYKIPPELHDCLKSFFEYLNYIPPNGIPELDISVINSNPVILNSLKEFK